ncbi:unnamed protein product [Prorocentrum cordatum]|uniref:Uncharacterized protein n=1 Tax=Prorocentrum cordatum TaxID=2364126 RepID=A0ABN9WS57_9DINO|nr:unnamed protein product [Polarella glacialis]
MVQVQHSAPLLLALIVGCSGISLHVKTPEAISEPACGEPEPGEWCRSAVMWARDHGAKSRPELFPGDPSHYSLHDFQGLLHRLRGAGCPQPCPRGGRLGPGALLQFNESVNDTEFDQELNEYTWEPRNATSPMQLGTTGPDCEDAHTDSRCAHAIDWLRDRGFARHPDWYPGLSSNSTAAEIQVALHSLGKSNCSRPCVGVASQLFSTQIGAAESSNEKLEKSAEVGDEAIIGDEDGKASSCSDTQQGMWCYRAIAWLKSDGIERHPDWYPGLTSDSSIPAFQKAMHLAGKPGCPMPCAEVPEEKDNRLRDFLKAKTEAELETENRSTPVEAEQETGNQTENDTHEPPVEHFGSEEGNDCHDALEGDQCFVAVMWAMEEGIDKHRVWYPGLSDVSSFREVQEHLYRANRSYCPRPCSGPLRVVERKAKEEEEMTPFRTVEEITPSAPADDEAEGDDDTSTE